MTRGMFLAVALVTGLAVLAPDLGDARPRRHHDHSDWHDRWENRRDARRAGVVAGIVVGGMARASANAAAERRYEECLYATGYDYECERMRYYDESRARRAGRRAGVAAGMVTYGIVRD